MKNMNGKVVPFVIRRGPMLKFLNLEVTSTTPSGLSIADGAQFDTWVANLKPICSISNVYDNSPAYDAGLCKDDQIVWCRSIVSTQQDAFVNLTKTIAAHKNQELAMYINRCGDIEHIIVVPSEWGGSGLTGMTIAKS